ncbi:MAG TPA: 3-hydroxyacyl-ACP dehydratase FabZ family protein [Burkholderiales bacterium]|nr:3-hydroxyacyl-ACP dehydratase FabZ family protein [Burkholderiales bacterium]
MRFYCVDRVLEVRRGEFVRGVKNVALSDDVFNEHFPDNPLYPGTLIVEALAQVGGFLVECSMRHGAADLRRAVLAQIDKAKFHQPCRPGDQIELGCSLVSTLEGAARVEGEARVRGGLAAAATLTFRLVEVASEAVHAQRRQLYRLWTQDLNLGFAIP